MTRTFDSAWMQPKGDQPGFSRAVVTTFQEFTLCFAPFGQGTKPQTTKIGNGFHLQFFANWANQEGPLWNLTRVRRTHKRPFSQVRELLFFCEHPLPPFQSFPVRSLTPQLEHHSGNVSTTLRGRPKIWHGQVSSLTKDWDLPSTNFRKVAQAFSRTVSLFAFERGTSWTSSSRKKVSPWSVHGETPNRQRSTPQSLGVFQDIPSFESSFQVSRLTFHYYQSSW